MFTTFAPSVFTELSKSYSTSVAKASSDFVTQVYSANQQLAKTFSGYAAGSEIQKFTQPVQDIMSGFAKTYIDSVTNFTKTTK